MRRLGWALAMAATTAALMPAGAEGSTPLGALTANDASCAGPIIVYGRSGSYVVPGDGVITQMQVRASNGASGAAMPLIVRPGAGTAFGVVGVTSLATFTSAYQVRTVPARIAVRAGDLLGLFMNADYLCVENGSPSDTIAYRPTGSAAAGDQHPSSVPQNGLRVSVTALLEADGDGDGFGDESQDGCPLDPASQAGTCGADVAAAVSASPGSIGIGDVGALLLSVRAIGGGARSAQLTTTLPAGLELVSSSMTGCGLTCTVGTLAPGERREIALIVRGKTAGAQTVTTKASQADAEKATGNDNASTTLTVDPPPLLPSPFVPPPVVVTPPPPVPTCRVPSARGQTRAVAKLLVEAAGCRLGTVRTRRVRRGRIGRVVAQKPAARAVVAQGTRVEVTVTARARRRR